MKGFSKEEATSPMWVNNAVGREEMTPYSLRTVPHPLQTGLCSLTAPIAPPSPLPLLLTLLLPSPLLPLLPPAWTPPLSATLFLGPLRSSEMVLPSLQRANTVIMSLDSRRWDRVSPPSPHCSPGIPSMNTRCLARKVVIDMCVDVPWLVHWLWVPLTPAVLRIFRLRSILKTDDPKELLFMWVLSINSQRIRN